MELNAFEKFEIQAKAFHILTGFMHPGKDTSPLCGASYEERKEAWDAWIKAHAAVVIAMITAVEHTLPDIPNERVMFSNVQIEGLADTSTKQGDAP